MQLHEWLSVERGRAKALADYLRVPASLISKMGSGEKRIPIDHCPDIEEFTGGQVTCEEQRPDKVAYFAKLAKRAANDDEHGPDSAPAPLVGLGGGA